MKTQKKFKMIDVDYLYNVSENIVFLKKIFSLFKDDVNVFKSKMPVFLKEKKYEDLAEIVHKAKSSVAILGMTKQSEEMKVLEKDIRNKNSETSFKNRIDRFFKDCDIAVEEIEILEKTL